MLRHIKKIKKLRHTQVVELANLSLVAAVLILAGVGISYGGVEKFSALVARTLPSSQVADVLPCSWFNGCGVQNTPHFGISSNISTVTSVGQPVTLTWTAYNYLNGANTNYAECIRNFSNGNLACSINGYGPVGDDANAGAGMLSAALSGSVTVYPTVTTTYYLNFNRYYGYVGGGNYGFITWSSGLPSVTVSVPCPLTSFASPWNSNSYLIYSGGQGTVYPPGGGRYCVHNYSSNAIFIPDGTQAEWNNFYNSAAGLSVGVSSY